MKKILKYLGLGFIALAFAVVLHPSNVFAAPVITSIAPNFGATAGGTAVTITGTGFDKADVTIGGVAATSIVLVNTTSITAVTPAGTAGLANVVVTNINASFNTLVNGFTYLVASSPEAVDLGTAGDFVILSKTGITATTGTVITGDLGISPAAATDMTGFGPVLDASGTFSTSSLVTTGRIYASDYSGGGGVTPAMLTQAVRDMETAYTAAFDPATTVLNAGAGNLGGMTLPAGVYTFDTAVTIPTDLTLNGSADDVWIFQISGNLSIASATDVLLTGEATANHVFWAVTGTTTLGSTSTFEGTILGGPDTTTIAMEDGATLNGKALGQKEVTLISNTITDSVTSDPKILVAGVTGFVAPIRNVTPILVGALTAGAATYTVTDLSWAPVGVSFGAGTVYVATIELTSAIGYKFPITGIAVPTTDVSGTVSAGITAGGDISGNTLTFTELFSKTGRAPSSGGSIPKNFPNTTTASGCSLGNLFNTSTGATCVNNAVESQGCSGGNAFNTSTGAVCTNNAVLQIPGCGNSATGFSVSTGGSCAGNHVTTPPATGNGYAFGNTLVKEGTRGGACLAWQTFLNVHGASLATDGSCGKLTMAAARAWQVSQGLVADGLLGAKSRAKANTQ